MSRDNSGDEELEPPLQLSTPPSLDVSPTLSLGFSPRLPLGLRRLPPIHLTPSPPHAGSDSDNTISNGRFSNFEIDEDRPRRRKSIWHRLKKIAVFCFIFTFFCVAITMVVLVLIPRPGPRIQMDPHLPYEQQIWWDKGVDEINAALDMQPIARFARNVILFVGDGMGPNTVTASRIYKYRETGLMTWEKFPYMGMLKTYCANKMVPDSFSTATALFGGVKVNFGTGGVDSSVQKGDCLASLDNLHKVETIMKWAQDIDINTGFVTNTRVTHATPAALYASVPDRRWECEERIPDKQRKQGCKDIAQLLMQGSVGKKLKVIMGGGRQCLVSDINGTVDDPLDEWACRSRDGRDLIWDWAKKKEDERARYEVLSNNNDLRFFDTHNTDYVLGIFANGHLKYDHERDTGPEGMPSLSDMTEKAVEVLLSKKKKFLLVVEGGNIDQAHHRGAAAKAILETIAFDLAINNTIKTLGDKLDETLIIVTADHAHTLTINGYPDIGSNIFGVAAKSKFDKIPYTTLTYGTSHFGGDQYFLDNKTNIVRRVDPSEDDLYSPDYIQQAAVKTDENAHGGSDVTVHAKGPYAHLFHGVHENSYVAHVISYALKMGKYRRFTAWKNTM